MLWFRKQTYDRNHDEKQELRGGAMTFSVAALDPETDTVGTAVASVFPAVGAVCPWVSEDGALLSQAWDSGATYGKPALNMLSDDLSLETAANALISERAGGKGTQLHGVEVTGQTFAYTGEKATDWAGHTRGKNYTVAGNTLVGEEVVQGMGETFANSTGSLSDRLIRALEAGERAGGDKRGNNLSAALLVYAPESELHHNLRVDSPGNPIANLREAYETAKEYGQSEDASSEVVKTWGKSYDPSIVDFEIRF